MNALNDLRSYSRNWLTEFIEKYKKSECLWQAQHPDYCNHNARYVAYDDLIHKLKEVEPNPDRPMVVRKINSLRSAFRREYRKKSTKPDYETRLWYYDKLLFIAEQNPRVAHNPKRPALSLKIDEDETNYEVTVSHQEQTVSGGSGGGGDGVAVDAKVHFITEHHETVDEQQMDEDHDVTCDEPLVEGQHIKLEHKSTPQAYKILEISALEATESSQRELQHAGNETTHTIEHHHHHQTEHHQQHIQTQQQTQTAQMTQLHGQIPTIQISREHLPIFNSSFSGGRHDDEFDAVGINVASKLRAMNHTQRIIAEKLIGDVLFNGQLNSLSVSSRLTQEP